ncbi:MAG TPA: CHAT domain-containing protein [Candidatus Eisenbacteria bacterium]|nr:CHAT domain-containing protein [Candidatus Eisenbacteria bacterium]
MRPPWPLIAAITLATLAALFLRDDAPQGRADALRRLAPSLSIEMAQHMANDDPASFRRFAAAVGTMELRQALYALGGDRLDLSSSEAYMRTWNRVAPHVHRVASALADEFHCPDYLRNFMFFARLTPAQAITLRQLLRQEYSVRTDPTAAPEAKLKTFAVLLDRFNAFGYLRGVVLTEAAISAEVMKFGDRAGRLHHLRLALAAARALGETMMTCQILGELGATHRSLGNTDSMLACYEEARRIAEHCRFPDQYSRILSFEARYHADEGRLALATDLVIQALQRCREMGGGAVELRFLASAMRHFAELGCWEIVDRLLDRAPVLLRRLAPPPATVPISALGADIELHRMRALLARGRIAEARPVMERVREQYRVVNPRVGYAAIFQFYGEGLIGNGRAAEALPWIERGLVHADSLHVPEVGVGLALRRARALYDVGSYEAAREALADFDRRASQDAGENVFAIDREILNALLLEREGAAFRSRAALRRALAEIQRHVRRLDAGPQGYLALGARSDVRDAVHRLMATTPEAGYAFELDWRRLTMELGGTHGAGDSTWGEPRSRPPSGTLHCVYRVGPHAVIRWTSSPSRVTRDTLALSPADCRRAVAQAVSWLSSRRPLDGVALKGLHRLAGLLLPAEAFRSSANPRTLYLTPDGALEQLPFEALSLSAERLEPLALARRVVYVGGGTGPSAPKFGSGSILAAAEPAPAMRRGALVSELRSAVPEAEVVRRAWPTASVIEGPRATKRAVLESWSRARRIHVAAHLVRDPEVPFIAYFPMARPDTGRDASDSYIEMADVRSLDLTGCEMVLLSSCASGAPYPTQERQGPSMGRAFLDAGAASVVQTHWPVEDEAASRFVAWFVEEWSRADEDPVGALSAARRRAIEAGEPPWRWAAWSISMGALPVRGLGEAERTRTLLVRR